MKYPNLLIVIVGAPGTGKGVVACEIREFLKNLGTSSIHIQHEGEVPKEVYKNFKAVIKCTTPAALKEKKINLL